MFKLLNRFAWILSISFGFIIVFSIVGLNSYRIGDDEIMSSIIIGTIFGFIIKKVLFSKKFIQTRLEFFVNQAFKLKKDFIVNKAESIKKEEKIEKVDELEEEKININDTIKNDKEYLNNDIKFEEQLNNDLNKTKEDINITNIEEENEKEIKEENKPSKIILYIKEFFAENLLAKIGSILVFLGVLFLMSLIWNVIPGVLKIIIGFIIGFGIYFSGVYLDKKGNKNESKILLGTGILINYLVILAGRYIIGDNYGDGTELILGTGITFLFLIFNTIFGVLTSLVYKSKNILIFSFLFAYLNPFLLGTNGDTPYVLVGYSMIVSLGALFIGIKQNNNILKICSFIFGNFLFLVAPFSLEIGWITKLLASGILGLVTIFNLYKIDIKDKKIGLVFILNYIFIILLLISGGEKEILGEGIGYISYMISILLFFGIGIFLILSKSIISVKSLFIFPILIVLGLIFSGVDILIIPSLVIIILTYLIGFIFINGIISNSLKYLFFVLIGFFIFLVNCNIGFNFPSNFDLSFLSLSITFIISFVFLYTSYFFSTKKDLQNLYIVGTIGTIAILLPILVYEPIKTIFDNIEGSNKIISNKEMIISIISVIIFSFSNQLLPFFNKNLIQNNKNIKNLIIGSVIGVLFIGGELFIYGSKYFPGVSLGFSFLALAILYFILGFIMFNKLGIEKVKNESISKNTILSYLFISISIFSLAIALVFSKHNEIISIIWLLESSILFYFYNKTKEFKVYIIGLILFVIGIFNLFTLLDVVSSREFIFLISFTIILASFIFNLKVLDFIKNGFERVSHDIFHIIGIGILGGLLYNIIPNAGYGWSLFGISIFVLIISFLYSYFNSKILKLFFIFCFILLILFHIGEFDNFIYKIDKNNLSYLRVLQYLTTGILGGTILFWNKFNKINIFNKIIKGIYTFYILIIVSFYINDIFNTTFAVTIFWSIISSLLLFFGIIKNIIKYRTMGLYLLSLVLIKIFIYDLWIGIDNAVSRVLALIGIGILLIIISIQYTKRYGNNLKGEFSLSNLGDK